MSTNKPSISPVVLEVALVVLRKCCQILSSVHSNWSLGLEPASTKTTYMQILINWKMKTGEQIYQG